MVLGYNTNLCDTFLQEKVHTIITTTNWEIDLLYYYSDLIQKLSLDAFDKPFDRKLGWLSVNEQNIKDYLNDPLSKERNPIG